MRKLICVVLVGSISCVAFSQDDEPTAGMSMKAFVKLRGEPDKKELRDGKDVWWYDGNTPYFAVFKNKKLDSFYTDQDTIDERNQDEMRQAEAEKREQYEAEMAEQQQRQNMMRAMQNFRVQKQEFRPVEVRRPVNTNCQMIGNQMNCSSY